MHDLLVEGPDDMVQIPTSVADVVHLGLEELVALAQLGELLQRQGVDRAQGGQFGLELDDAGGWVGALSQFRGGGDQGVVRRAAQIMAEVLDQGLTPDSGLHQVQLDLLQAAAGSSQLVLTRRALSAQFLQPGPAGLDRLQLEAVSLTQVRQRRVQPGLGLAHHIDQPGHGGGVGLQSRSPLGGLSALVRMPGEPPLHLREAVGQHPTALDQPGRAHLPLAAQRARPRRSVRRWPDAPGEPTPFAARPGRGPLPTEAARLAGQRSGWCPGLSVRRARRGPV